MSELDVYPLRALSGKIVSSKWNLQAHLAYVKKNKKNNCQQFRVISFKQKVLSQTIVDSTSYTDIIDWTQLSFSFLSGFASRGSVLYGHFAKSIVIDSWINMYSFFFSGTHWYTMVPTGTKWYTMVPTGTHWYPVLVLLVVLLYSWYLWYSCNRGRIVCVKSPNPNP